MTVYLGNKPVGVTKIVKKEVAKKKFGVSIDNIIGDVDADGVYTDPTETFEIDFSKLLVVKGRLPMGNSFLPYICYNNVGAIGTIDLSNFTGTFDRGHNNLTFLEYGFANSGINKVILPRHLSESSASVFMNNSFEECKLDLVEFNGVPLGISYFQMSGTFKYATIQEIKGLDTIEIVYRSGLSSTFSNATLPEELNFVSLATLEERALQSTFAYTKGLEKVYFPALISAHTQAFGYTSSTVSFYKSSVTEIHFRADAQATIEALYGYSSKFGATNASIMFDL